mgnify:CR=1 FL=1
MTGLSPDKREVLVTHLMDAEPDHRQELPGPTPWPFLTGLAVAGLYIGSMFTPWAVVWGALPVTIGLLGWAWPRKGKKPSELALHLAHTGDREAEHA